MSASFGCGALIAALLAVLGVGFFNLSEHGGDAKIQQIIANENQYYAAKNQVVADYVKQKYPGKQLLIIVNEENEHNRDRLQVIRTAFADAKVTWHALAPPKIEVEGDGFDIMEEMVTSEDFNKILHQYPKVDIVLSTVGLPMDYTGMLTWDRLAYENYQRKFNRKPPSLVLFDAYIYDLKRYINGEQIAAAVTHKPDAEYRPDDVVPEDHRAAFDKRFLLITPENVKAMAEKYELFAE